MRPLAFGLAAALPLFLTLAAEKAVAATACYFSGYVKSVQASGNGGAASDLVVAQLEGTGSDGSTAHNFYLTRSGVAIGVTNAKISLAVASYVNNKRLLIIYYPVTGAPDFANVVETTEDATLPQPTCVDDQAAALHARHRTHRSQ